MYECLLWFWLILYFRQCKDYDSHFPRQSRRNYCGASLRQFGSCSWCWINASWSWWTTASNFTRRLQAIHSQPRWEIYWKNWKKFLERKLSAVIMGNWIKRKACCIICKGLIIDIRKYLWKIMKSSSEFKEEKLDFYGSEYHFKNSMSIKPIWHTVQHINGSLG